MIQGGILFINKHEIIKRGLKAIPYPLFVRMYPSLKKTKLIDFADDVYYKRFFIESPLITDTEKYLSQIIKKKRKMVIKKGVWNYQVANFCFVKDMLSVILWCIDCGYIPLVDIYPSNSSYYNEKKRLWDLFYEQPLKKEIKTEKFNEKECPIQESSIRARFSDVYDTKKVVFWNKMLSLFVKYNSDTQSYFEDENHLIENKRVVGCVLRSTDYIKLRPSEHPIQPSLEETFDKLHLVMAEYKIDYVYLATEDYLIADAFKKEFPNRVIENKRHYFNDNFEKNALDRISQVHFERENDDYLKMLEYISSINIVSRCDCLVTGLNGGSEMAIYRNGNQYKYMYVFDKGVY